nr:GtrA family protein [Streptomyces shenzhenensis]
MAEPFRTPAAPGPLASFLRFVLCGGGVGLACGPAVALLALSVPWAVANAVVTVASTLLCTELHARFTFGTGRRAGWRQHGQSAGSATAAYAVTSGAMLVLHTLQPSPGAAWEQVVYLSASGLAGIGRFLVLRLFVFAGRKQAVRPAPGQEPRAAERSIVRHIGREQTLRARSPAGSTAAAGGYAGRPSRGRHASEPHAAGVPPEHATAGSTRC